MSNVTPINSDGRRLLWQGVGLRYGGRGSPAFLLIHPDGCSSTKLEDGGDQMVATELSPEETIAFLRQLYGDKLTRQG